MDQTRCLEILAALGFQESAPDEYVLEIHSYKLTVTVDAEDPKRSSINYGPEIKVFHGGIASFGKEENIVQLECVVRLLRKGYSPKSIELEKQYRLGHADKGRLDVHVKKGRKSWAMIECKTYGSEYRNERDRVLRDGGQIFSYYAQDRNAKAIGIYCSTIENGQIRFESEQIHTEGLDASGDAKDIHASWDKDFIPKGLFDPALGLYELTAVNLRKRDLIDLTKETGRGLFNSFAETLRRYAISDKSNAFNAIFNLFVCKIYDEDTKAEDEELDFQWGVGDNLELLITRLSQLYYASIRKYLHMNIGERFFPKSSDGRSIAIREFSFIEVNNEASFEFNGSILVDVVKTLQKYRIKYSTKHQFLGEFFEQLLTTGVKQEAGQFFTPIPLARFILRSLPIDRIITRKIKARDPHILPYVIDNACGSGHFLTESMGEIEAHFAGIPADKLSGQQKRYFDSMRSDYLWARDYLYGIEKDTRLAKTTKIAMFLNGDVDATIIGGDGLDDFHASSSYMGLLRAPSPAKAVNTFDILVSNPPFSVEGFANTLKNGADNFTLTSAVGKKSTEIECFFIERMAQLLAGGGVAGIILPLSILNNNRSVYVQARSQLLVNFRVVSLVELRNKAFLATGTSVVVLFLRKRTEGEIERLFELAEGKAAGESRHRLDACKAHYRQHGYLDDDCFGLLTHTVLNEMEAEEDTLIAFSGEKKQQEHFLGYRISKGRGREGLTELKRGLLIDPAERYSDHALATRIHDAFLGSDKSYPPSELDKFAATVKFVDLVQPQKGNTILPPSSILGKKTLKIDSLSPAGDFIDAYASEETTLGELIDAGRIEIIAGLTYDKTLDEVPVESRVRVATASNLDIQTGKLHFGDKLIYLREDFGIVDKLAIRKNDIIMSMSSGSLRHLAKVSLAERNYDDIMIGGFLHILRPREEELALALYYRFLSKQFREFVFSKKGQNINNIHMSDLRPLKLRLPKDLTVFAAEAKGKYGW